MPPQAQSLAAVKFINQANKAFKKLIGIRKSPDIFFQQYLFVKCLKCC